MTELRRSYLKNVAHGDVRPGSASLMQLIAVNHTASQAELAKALQIDKATLVALIDKKAATVGLLPTCASASVSRACRRTRSSTRSRSPIRQTWTAPSTAALDLKARPDDAGVFEYACHEGNYGMRNMLSAARYLERAAGEKESRAPSQESR